MDRFGHPKYINDTDILHTREVIAVSGVEGALKPEARTIKNQINQLKSKVMSSIHSLSVNDDGQGSLSGRSGKRSNGSGGRNSDQQLSLITANEIL